MRTINFEVTQQDINQGTRQSCNNCPVALSLQREFRKLHPEIPPQNIGIKVGCTKFSVWDGGKKKYFGILPDVIGDWIMGFDTNRPNIQPFTGQLLYHSLEE